MSDENKPKGPSNEPKGDEGIEEPKPQDGEPGEDDEPKPDEPKPGEGDEPKPDEPKPGEGEDDETKPDEPKPGEGDEPKDQKPEKAEDYSFAKVLPEGVPEDSPLVAEFKKSAFEQGLTQSQAEAVLAFYGQTKEAELVARGKLIEQGMEILKQDWREDFDKNMKLADKAVERFGGQQFLDELHSDPLGVSPNMAKFLFRVGQAISEDTFVQGEPSKNSKAEQADAELYGDID